MSTPLTQRQGVRISRQSNNSFIQIQYRIRYLIVLAYFIQEIIKGMSQPQKKKQFVLPSTLKHLQQNKQAQANQFIKDLDTPQAPTPQKSKPQRPTSLFKFNHDSTAIISEVPVDTLRKRSKSQRLQTLQEEQQKTFELMDHYKEHQTKRVKDKYVKQKIYQNIDARYLVGGEGKEQGGIVVDQKEVEEVQDEFQIVRPSQAYLLGPRVGDSVFQPTVFQTPILPCFASEFRPKAPEETKKIRQGEGLWRLGKMRIKGGKCQLRIGEFVFEGFPAPAEGKAGLLSQDPNRQSANDRLHMLPNWQQLCILQPHQQLFSQ